MIAQPYCVNFCRRNDFVAYFLLEGTLVITWGLSPVSLFTKKVFDYFEMITRVPVFHSITVIIILIACHIKHF